MAAQSPRIVSDDAQQPQEVFTDIVRLLAIRSCRRELLRCPCGGRCARCQGWRAFVIANTGRRGR